MGIRFRFYDGSDYHDIIMHVRMLDMNNRLQQEAIGMLGVNLAYGAFHFHNSPDAFISSLTDSIGDGRVEVDMIEFNGPEFGLSITRILLP